jgi:hypothetical protein
VVQQGIGTNPFNGAGFNPDAVPPAAVNLNEGQVRSLTINLPFEAGLGGQRLQLTLAGPNASTFTVLTGGSTVTPQNGSVFLTIPEGQRQLTIGLRSTQKVTATSALSVSATLLDATGTPTIPRMSRQTSRSPTPASWLTPISRSKGRWILL